MIFKHKEAAAVQGWDAPASFRLQAQQCVELLILPVFPFKTRSLMMSFVTWWWLWSHWSYEKPSTDIQCPERCWTHIFTVLEHIWTTWTGEFKSRFAVSSRLIRDWCVMSILFRFPPKCSIMFCSRFHGNKYAFHFWACQITHEHSWR